MEVYVGSDVNTPETSGTSKRRSILCTQNTPSHDEAEGILLWKEVVGVSTLPVASQREKESVLSSVSLLLIPFTR